MQEFPLDGSKSVYTVGSAADNDFVISDKKVSPKHLRIEQFTGSYYIAALDSTVSTRLNGRPLFKRVQIVDGDDISIGDHNLIFDSGATNKITDIDVEDNDLEIIGEDDLPDPVDLPPQPSTLNLEEASTENISTPSATSSDEFYEVEEFPTETLTDELTGSALTPQYPLAKSLCLLAIYGPYIGKKFALNDGDTKIGRELTLNDIVIRHNERGDLDASISRRHATISKKNGNYYITDKRSKTRTYVNQIKLEPTDEILIREKDEIEIVSDQKSTIFRVLSEGANNSAPPKKAGVWWTRNNLRSRAVLTVLFGLLTFTALGLSCSIRMVINATPAELKFYEETWFQNKPGQYAPLQHASLALADLTGDATVDLAFINPSGHLIGLDGTTKERIWQKDNFVARHDIDIVLADLNINGLKDVIVVGQDSRLHAFDGISGAEIWLSPILSGTISGAPVVDDLNDDGLQDVLICSQTGQVHLGYNNIYELNWTTIETALTIISVPSTIDYNGDGSREILVGTEEGKIVIINGKSGIVSRIFDIQQEISKATGDDTGHSIRYPVAAGDLNNNGSIDLLIGTETGHFLAVEGSALSPLWHESLFVDSDFTNDYLSPAIGRLDEDDVFDAVLVSNQSIKILECPGDNAESAQTIWQYDIESADYFATPATLADFNKDKLNDVIIGGADGNIYIFDGRSGEIITQIYDHENPVVSPILAADLGNDGYLDLMCIRQDGNIYKIQSNSPIPENSIVWGQVYDNEAHNGIYKFELPSSAKYDILMATFGGLFLAVGFLTFRGYQGRRKHFQQT